LVGLFHVTVLHPPDALLGGRKCRREDRIEHQAGAAAFSCAIGDGGPAVGLRLDRHVREEL
jgi:hypothetical protein